LRNVIFFSAFGAFVAGAMLFAVAAAVSPSPRGIVRYRTGNRVSVPRDVAPSVGGGMRRKPRVDDYLYLFVVAIVAIFACPSTPAPALADAMEGDTGDYLVKHASRASRVEYMFDVYFASILEPG